ncbi:MAG: HNH endonuclease [Gammaproteobacteria bacterium]|nr:HNH endonuclease [Gammaproteobacteria bacterium]
MKSLLRVPNPPSYISRHDGIVDSKRDVVVRTQLQSINALIEARYDEYEYRLDNDTVHQMVEHPVILASANDLQSCYKSKTKGLKVLLSEIGKSQRQRVLERCPYCGITLPRTYDHYLPKDKYPELSVHVLNLIPCCNECNSSKGDRWSVAGGRLFLHFYRDDLPQSQYLFVEIATRPNTHAYGVKYSLSANRPNDCAQGVWDLIVSHYSKLGLLDKYRNQSNNEISNTFSTCVAHIKDGGRSISNFINMISDTEEQIFGSNHWRVVLRRALASTEEFERHVLESAAS